MAIQFAFADSETIIRESMRAFKPPPDINCAEFAETERRLSVESSASPGRFRFDKTPFMREPYEMVGRSDVRSIAMMCSAQVGKSTFIENVIAYYIALDACPILHISPTLDSMKMFSKERLSPMIRDTPILKGLVREAKTRDSGNTIANKKFPGGHLAMVGSNSPSGLASRPIRVLVADEVDRFERSAGSEGDPLKLGVKRTTTYWNRVLVYVSTPGDKYNAEEQTGSRIEKEFLDGDQRHFHAKCVHCDHEQKMDWFNGVRWDKDEDGNSLPHTAYYVCAANGCIWNDLDRAKAMRAGRWIAEKPFNGRVSYCLSQLNSLFAPLSEGVSDFLNSKSDPMLYKTWWNTFLGLPWEDRGKRVDATTLSEHREDYNTTDDIPEGIVTITAAVDVQDNRFEYEIIGWGENKESWSLAYDTIYATDSLIENEPWRELDLLLNRTFIHPLYGEMPIRNTCVDSGGHFTQKVYSFCKFRPRVQAIKGVSGFDKPFVGRPSTNTLDKSRVYPLGVDVIKQTVAARFRINDSDEPGYCRFPLSYKEDVFRMFTAEELKDRMVNGRKIKKWTNIRPRNEAFDCRVYATAALHMMSIDLKSEKRRLLREARRRDNITSKDDKQKSKSSKSKGGTWAENWKNG
jgi:phage terminase large subunit GpA-like protein